MQLTCPCCMAHFPVEAALTDEQARQAVAAALGLPAPLGDRLLRYVALFRPASRALSWDRAGRLLNELLAMIEAGRIEREGRRYRAGLECWRQALDEILDARDRLRLPFKSHGYLLEIIAALSPKVEAAEEASREADRRTGRHRKVEETPSTREIGAQAVGSLLAGLRGKAPDA